MSEFNPIPTRSAAAIVEAAGLGESSKVLVDFAAAGLLKGYARLIETIHSADEREEVRDSRISRDLWRRVAEAGMGEDLAVSGTVRLPAIDPGQPAVDIIGIRFDDKTLQVVVDQHSNIPRPAPSPVRNKPARKSVMAPAETVAADASIAAAAVATASDRQGIPPIPRGAALATVNQAMATLGLGRTKVNELMKTGRLVRRHIDGGVRIEVASIYALCGDGHLDGGLAG